MRYCENGSCLKEARWRYADMREDSKRRRAGCKEHKAEEGMEVEGVLGGKYVEK